MTWIMKGAYYPCWAQDMIPPSSINTNLFTHIYYASLTPTMPNSDFNIPPTQAHFLVNLTSTLRAANPPAKTLFSINGNRYFMDDRPLFARLSSNSSSRAKFICSGMRVAREFGFDGIDFNLKYPQNQAEMDDLGALLEEWRAEVRREAAATGRPPLLLTAAVHNAPVVSGWQGNTRAYPTASIAENLDWVNLANYDYSGSWDRPWATGAHAALHENTSYGLGEWIRAGVPGSKLVMGLPMHGRTWRLENPAGLRGIGAPAVGVGPGVNGEMTYAEVVRFNEERGAEVVYDSASVSVYSVAGSSWIGYDDPRSVAAKIDYARGLGLGGYFVSSILGDNDWEISERASELWSQ